MRNIQMGKFTATEKATSCPSLVTKTVCIISFVQLSHKLCKKIMHQPVTPSKIRAKSYTNITGINHCQRLWLKVGSVLEVSSFYKAFSPDLKCYIDNVSHRVLLLQFSFFFISPPSLPQQILLRLCCSILLPSFSHSSLTPIRLIQFLSPQQFSLR